MDKIKIKLLNNGKAVILTRQPIVVYNELCLSASEAPQNTSLSVRTPTTSLYRELSGGECVLPASKLNGVLSLYFTVVDDSVPLKKWYCEEMKAERLKDGGVLICPNDFNLPQAVADLLVENDEIRKEYKDIKDCLKKTNERVDKIFEAYKFV
jgi:hypothetical protein